LCLTAAWCALAACAERQALPPGDELEFPEAAHHTVAPADTSKPADHEALAASFQPKAAAPDTPQEAYARALAAAQPRLAGEDALDSLAALDELRSLAKKAGPEAEQQLIEREVALRTAAKDATGAADAAERWLLSCGPDGVNACRAKALTAMSDAARGRSAAVIRARVATIRGHDACMGRAMSTGPGALPACFASALAFYQTEGDALMVRRGYIARIRAAGRFATPQLFVDGDKACTQDRCMAPTRRALRDAVQADLHTGDARQALLVALQEARVAFAALAPEQAVQARTELVERACAALDARDGTGSCRRLEHETVSHVAFKDFSRETLKGEGLPPQSIKEVNDAFGVMIQECLKGEADRLKPPESEHYGLSWVVRNDGRVGEVHLDKKDADEGLLAQCLRAQFALWRYPRYRGELQHVEQRFVVSAREHR
jgi:hypothetical protein